MEENGGRRVGNQFGMANLLGGRERPTMSAQFSICAII